MNVLGDMVENTGYPVMVVIMVDNTKIETDATVLPEIRKEDEVCCFCIYTGEVISLISSFQIIVGLKPNEVPQTM